MPLTDTACKNARSKEKPYKLADAHGLYLEVQPNGAKYWRLKYRFGGKEKRLAVGVYPETSLQFARDKRYQARKLLDAGIDPAQARREEKRQANLNSQNTFEAIAREWHNVNIGKWTPRHGADVLHRLEMDVFPVVGMRPIADLDAPDMLEVLRRVEKRGALEIAKRLGQTSGQVFRYAIATGRAKRNPMPDLKDALKPVVAHHYAALETKDLPDFLHVLEHNDARLYLLTRLAIRLIMLTFVRTGELIGAKWEEFDLENAMWTIPAQRMKMRQAHHVPLSRQALEILQELQAHKGRHGYVFPNQANPLTHMSNNTILYALGRLGYKGRMTGHGFRALAMSTIKEHLGYRHEVIDRQLAHGHKNKVDAAYDRAQFLNERIEMMQTWADFLDALLINGTLPRKMGKAA